MICAGARTEFPAPRTYQQLLDCLSALSGTAADRSSVCAAMAQGSFAGSPAALVGLQEQMLLSIRNTLTRVTKRFLRELNDSLSFHDFTQTEVLCRRLRRDVQAVLFFRELEFLPQSYRDQLLGSITAEMTGFWDRVCRFLQQQVLEYPDPDLEDAVFLIGRIKLFPKQW